MEGNTNTFLENLYEHLNIPVDSSEPPQSFLLIMKEQQKALQEELAYLRSLLPNVDDEVIFRITSLVDECKVIGMEILTIEMVCEQ